MFNIFRNYITKVLCTNDSRFIKQHWKSPIERRSFSNQMIAYGGLRAQMRGHSPDAQYFWSATDQAGLLVACVWPLTVMLIEAALQPSLAGMGV